MPAGSGTFSPTVRWRRRIEHHNKQRNACDDCHGTASEETWLIEDQAVKGRGEPGQRDKDGNRCNGNSGLSPDHFSSARLAPAVAPSFSSRRTAASKAAPI